MQPMGTASFEAQMEALLPGATFFYDSQSLHVIKSANVNLEMFFRTGKDLCSMRSTRYVSSHRPRFVLADSDRASAYAVWNDDSKNVDWVVVTTSLISSLVELGQVVATYFSRSRTLGIELPYVQPLLRELDSEEAIQLFGLSLTQLAFIFVVGHELGHHACGHEVLYRKVDPASPCAAVDERQVARQAAHSKRLPGRRSIEPDLDRREMDFQAMEMAADHCGVEVLILNVVKLMRRARTEGFGIAGNGVKANNVMQGIFCDTRTSVFVAASSLILAFVSFHAGEWDVSGMTNLKHPLPSVRAFAMIELIQTIALPDDVASDIASISLWGPLSHVAVPLAAAVFSMRIEDTGTRQFTRTKFRAWRLLGISRAALTPQLLSVYLTELRRRWSIQRQQCRPAWRYDEPGPIVDSAVARP